LEDVFTVMHIDSDPQQFDLDYEIVVEIDSSEYGGRGESLRLLLKLKLPS
jgi:hypothetical protein